MSTARAGTRAVKDKPLKMHNSNTQNSKPDSQTSTKNQVKKHSDLTSTKNQPTAEQLRLANLTDSQVDIETQNKLKQITDLTFRSIEDAMEALHDCDYDMNRAVERLLESTEVSQGKWQEAVSKKKKNASNKTNAAEPITNSVNHKSDRRRERSREVDGEEENDRGDRGSGRGRRNDSRQPPRFQRGRGRENIDGDRNDSRSRDRPSGERGRGRAKGVSGGRGRGRGTSGSAVNSRGGVDRGGFPDRAGFSDRSGFTDGGGFGDRGRTSGRTSGEKAPQIDTWTNDTADDRQTDNSMGAWSEDWGADEWTGSLDEAKIFTASSQSDAKLYSPPSSVTEIDSKFDTQVYTASSLSNSNSSKAFEENSAFGISGLGQDSISQPAISSLGQNAIGQNSLGQNAVGQNSLGQNAIGQSPIGQTSLGQSAIGQNSLGQTAIGQTSLRQNSRGQRLELGMLLPKTSNTGSGDMAPRSSTQAPATASQFLSQYAKEASENIKNAVGAGSTASPSSQQQYLTQYNKEATESIKNAVGIGSTVSSTQPAVNHQPHASVNHPTSTPPGLTNITASAGQPLPQRSTAANKQPRPKQPPPSKIPASAVVMPGGMNYHLDVQFGNLDFSGGQETSETMDFTVGGVSSTASSASFTTTTSSVGRGVQQQQQEPPTQTIDTSPPQPPRSPVTIYHSNNSTPSKDFSHTNIAAQPPKISSTPEPISYPTSQPDRKSSPYMSQRSQQLAGSTLGGSSKPASGPQVSFSSQPNAGYASYASSYKNQQQQSHVSTAFSSQPTVASGINSSQPQQYTPSTYHNSTSFQTPVSSSYGAPAQASSSYGAPSQASSNALFSQGGSSSSSYPGQTSSSFPAGYGTSQSTSSSTSYHSRDSSSGSQSSFPTTSQQQSVAQSYQSSQPNVQTVSYARESTNQNAASYAGAGTPYNMPSSKLTESLNSMVVKDSGLDTGSGTGQYMVETAVTSSPASLSTNHVNVSSVLGLSATSNHVSTATPISAAPAKSTAATKPPPNLPPGVPILPQNYMVGQPAMPFAAFGLSGQAIPQYSYEELQILAQQRLPLPGYYDMPLQPATTLASASVASGRADQNPIMAAASVINVPYTGSDSGSKLPRVDAQSPVSSQPSAVTAAHQPASQTFINPAAAAPAGMAPSYNYYYPSMLPGYSYPTNLIQVPSVTNATHGGSSGSAPFQKQAYASHSYGSGQAQDYKSYGGVSQQSKGSVVPAAPTVTTSAISDMTSPGYGGKTHSQSYDKGAFHTATGTPPPYGLLPTAGATQAGAALGQPGAALGQPGAALGQPGAAYAAPYGIPIMTPHNQMMHHALQTDASGGSSRGSQPSSAPKGATSKPYSTAYWGTN